MLTRGSAPPAVHNLLRSFLPHTDAGPADGYSKVCHAAFVLDRTDSTVRVTVQGSGAFRPYEACDLDVRHIQICSLYTVFFAAHRNFRSHTPCSSASTSAPAAPAPSSSTAQATSSPRTPPSTPPSAPSTSAGPSRTPKTGGAPHRRPSSAPSKRHPQLATVLAQKAPASRPSA